MLILWMAVPVAFWLVYYHFTRGAVTRHLGFLHFALYFFSIYLGAYRLYVDDGSWNDRFIFSVLAYPLVALAGMLFAQWFAWRTMVPDGAMHLNRQEARLVSSTVAFFLSLFAVYLYSLGGDIPLLGLLRGGESGVAQLARFMATKGYEGEGVGGLRLFFWLPRVLIDYFASFVVVFAFLWARKLGRGYIRFMGVFTGLAFLALLMVEKYPAAKLFAILALLVFNLKNQRVRIRSVVTITWLVTVGVLFAGVVYSFASGAFRGLAGTTVAEKVVTTGRLGLDMLSTRGVVGQAQPLYQIYRLVPRDYDYFGGRTLTNPRGILPYSHVPLNYLVYDSYLEALPGVRGADPTVFYGEIYANWGLLASLAGMFLFGLLLQLLNHRLARDIATAGSVFDVAFFYLVLIYLGDFALSFSTVYFDERFWFFLAFYFIRKRLAGVRVPERPHSLTTSEGMA
jgi:hypothetical protein